MKPADAPTLSQHLLYEAARFLVYPIKVRRSKLTMVIHESIDFGTRQMMEWRRTFSPEKKSPAKFFTDDVMLDQICCNIALRDVPGVVERTKALRALTLSGISNAEYFVYLREAAQCYVAGLPQAAIALSRAAVENRLKEVCAKHLGQRAVEDKDLIELIDRAASYRALTREGRDRAHLVRLAGNAVLHDEPAASDALAVVEAARDVIMMLHGK